MREKTKTVTENPMPRVQNTATAKNMTFFEGTQQHVQGDVCMCDECVVCTVCPF